jgi:hypothetical protein
VQDGLKADSRESWSRRAESSGMDSGRAIHAESESECVGEGRYVMVARTSHGIGVLRRENSIALQAYGLS